jgi:hypothetical protein
MRDTFDRLQFDIGFVIGQVTKAEMQALKGHDRTESDRVTRNIAKRIVTRLRESYEIKAIVSTEPAHTTSFGGVRQKG